MNNETFSLELCALTMSKLNVTVDPPPPQYRRYRDWINSGIGKTAVKGVLYTNQESQRRYGGLSNGGHIGGEAVLGGGGGVDCLTYC